MRRSNRSIALETRALLLEHHDREMERSHGKPNIIRVFETVGQALEELIGQVRTEPRPDVTLSVQQQQLVMEVHGIVEQIEKGHYLNVHFRAFKLSSLSWDEHVRQNAVAGSERYNSPGGAVLDGERDGSFRTAQSTETQVLVHTDGGSCHGQAIVGGICRGCGLSPDMQSTSRWPSSRVAKPR